MSPKAEEPVETVSFRIPASLKAAVEQAAELRHETATAVFRAALEDHFAPSKRIHELPGFTKRFDDFLAAKERGIQPALLVVDGRDGPQVYEGSLDLNNTGESLVALETSQGTYVFPRAHIIAWEGGADGKVSRMAMALRRSGYAVMTKGHGY